MKKIFICAFALLLTVACNDDSSTELSNDHNFSTKRTTISLASNPEFIKFANNYINTALRYSSYQKKALSDNYASFKDKMSDDTLNETEIEDVYTTHNIDYEKILEFQNTLDNISI